MLLSPNCYTFVSTSAKVCCWSLEVQLASSEVIRSSIMNYGRWQRFGNDRVWNLCFKILFLFLSEEKRDIVFVQVVTF